MRRIGFIGISAIGLPMAQRLLQQGLDVIALRRRATASWCGHTELLLKAGTKRRQQPSGQ